MSISSRENRKVRRLILDSELKVLLCSIGAQVKYELNTRNISYTGFFLEFESPGRFPFNASSIMEVWLELEQGNTIFFNGKMARVVHPGDEAVKDTGPGIAIRIVQIDRTNEKALEEFITRRGGFDDSSRDAAS